MNANLRSENLFRMHFVSFRILGLLPTEKYHQLYTVYSVFINTFLTIGYPLHLMIGLFMSTTMFDSIKNLNINLTCFVCSVKIIAVWLKFKNVQDIMDILKSQDQRIRLAEDEYHYYKNVVLKIARLIWSAFVKMYTLCWFFSEMLVLCYGFMGTWNLMYPAYFPFDPFASTTLYVIAHLYQYIGLLFQILQGTTNDSFAAMNLALLSGQIHTLSMRVSKLGRDKNKTMAENNEELLQCIEDHKELLRYRCKLEEVISAFMFCQILTTSINMCALVVLVGYFDTDIFAVIYYLSYFLSITLQIWPICYYGTIMEDEFRNLTYALFTSNWLEQDEKFKKILVIFIENTKKPLYIKAWLFPIDLNLFLSACKNAYSLFALVLNIKSN